MSPQSTTLPLILWVQSVVCAVGTVTCALLGVATSGTTAVLIALAVAFLVAGLAARKQRQVGT